MYTQIEEANLVSDLLYVLGVNVNPSDNIIMDQDTNNPILFEGKNIKATRNPAKPAYISENDVKLDPINPRYTKLMSKLFGFYLDKEFDNGNLGKVLSFYFDDHPDEENDSCKLIIKFEGGEIVESNYYRSKALAYTEAIMMLDGSFPIDDLKKFDVDDDVELRR